MIDRGFVKWQPFNSLTPLKDTVKELEEEKAVLRPTLFPEEISLLNDEVLDAYYSGDIILITYYEAGKIKQIRSTIKKIHPNANTIELGCKKILSFKQIIHIS